MGDIMEFKRADLNVTNHSRIYPTIDPTKHFEGKTYKGKVVLVTGASRGIGQDVARHYALAGASVTLVSRRQSALDDVKAAILLEVPDADVLLYAADVKDPVSTEAAVNATLERFGRLDVLIANAGVSTPFTQKIAEKDPILWWDTIEVNVRGVFNFVRPAIHHLEQSQGYIVAVSSGVSQLVFPTGSDYGVSKHAVDRLIEFIVTEYPRVKAFALHPGVVPTDMSRNNGLDMELPDSSELPASTMLWLTAGNADWLSGRYVSSNWDLGEVERDWKEKIISQHALVKRLCIPQ